MAYLIFFTKKVIYLPFTEAISPLKYFTPDNPDSILIS